MLSSGLVAHQKHRDDLTWSEPKVEARITLDMDPKVNEGRNEWEEDSRSRIESSQAFIPATNDGHRPHPQLGIFLIDFIFRE